MLLAIDEDSYREFVSARRRALLRTAFLLTGDWHAAEDVVQETLTKLYLSWRRIRRRDEADAYARKTLVNAYIDSTRRPWRREHAVDAVPDRAGSPDPVDGSDPTARGRRSSIRTPAWTTASLATRCAARCGGWLRHPSRRMSM